MTREQWEVASDAEWEELQRTILKMFGTGPALMQRIMGKVLNAEPPVDRIRRVEQKLQPEVKKPPVVEETSYHKRRRLSQVPQVPTTGTFPWTEEAKAALPRIEQAVAEGYPTMTPEQVSKAASELTFPTGAKVAMMTPGVLGLPGSAIARMFGGQIVAGMIGKEVERAGFNPRIDIGPVSLGPSGLGQIGGAVLYPTLGPTLERVAMGGGAALPSLVREAAPFTRRLLTEEAGGAPWVPKPRVPKPRVPEEPIVAEAAATSGESFPLVYHGTTEERASQILSKGFRLERGEGPGLALTTDLEKARGFAADRAAMEGGSPVILQVDPTRAKRVRWNYPEGTLGSRDKEVTVFDYRNLRAQRVEPIPSAVPPTEPPAVPGIEFREGLPIITGGPKAGQISQLAQPPGFVTKNIRARLAEMEPPPEPAGPRLPTIRDVEARSKPIPPEVRAELGGQAPAMRFELEPFATVSQRWGNRFVENWWTKAEDLLGGKISAVARSPEEIAVRRAFILRDLYASTQSDSMRSGVLEWLGRNRRVLGINGRGQATAVKVAAGAEIPKGLEQRLMHIVEHPEKYVLTGEQQAAIKEATDRFTMMLRRQQAEGVNIREWQEGYWHRIVTKRPAAEPGRIGAGVGRLGARPPAARMRVFGDVEKAWNRGFRYANDVDAMMTYGQDASGAIADRNTVRTVQNLGFKPSEKVDPAIIQDLKEARAEYKAARAAASKIGAGTAEKATALEAQARLDNAMRAMRLESRTWAERQPKVFGRIVSPEVANEFSRYVGDLPEGTIDQVFQLLRANMIWGDLSAAGVQTPQLIFRDPVTWVKAATYSVRAMASEPTSYIVKNVDAIESGIRFAAIRAPDEFLLRTGKGIAYRFGQLPGVKQTQRAFEWDIFVAQTERWKAVQRMATTPDELLELASEIRAQTGTALMPGLTRAQAKVWGRTWFAGKFLVSTLAVFKNAMRSGVAGAEARRTLAQVFGGVAATTAAINMVLTGEPGNFTDPDKPGFLGTRIGGGYVYLYGPFQPFLVAGARSARASVMLAQGKKPSNRDLQAWPRLFESKLSLLYRLTTQGLEALGVPLEAIRGEPYETPKVVGVGGWVRQLGEYMPIGPVQAVQGIKQGFYAAGLEVLGAKTTPFSPYVKLTELWEKYRSQLPAEYGPAPDYDKTTGGMRSWFYDLPEVAPVRERQIKEGEERGKEWAGAKTQVDKFTADWEPTFAQALADPQGRTNRELSDAMAEHLADRAKLSEQLYGNMGENDPRGPQQKLVDDYYALELPSLATPEQREDFFAQQDAMIAEHPELLQELHDVQVLKFQNPAVREFAEKRWQAKQVLKEYYNIPAFTRLSVEEGRKLSRILAEASDMVSLGKAASQKAALRTIYKEGRLTTKEYGIAMNANRRGVRNRKRAIFWKANADVLEMFSDIPAE